MDLAHVTPFRLGEVDVYPATRQLIRDGQSETLEPRVMQVLVALANAKGTVLTRDELIEQCWGGRIVGENAINRVISRIRQVAADFGMDSFQLETITKVGYRMIVGGAGSAASPAPQAAPERADTSASPVTRRRLVGGGLALAGALGAGFFVWNGRRDYEPTVDAQELFRRGEFAQRQGLADQTRQAVSFFEQAVAADPRFAGGWGALALSYRHLLEGFGEAQEASLPELIRSAARRALALDPDNGDAQLALLTVKPYYRNWAPMEAGLRRLADRFPDHWLVQAQLGLLLQDVGRMEESIAHSQRVIAIDPYLPVAHAFLARGLNCAGRLQETDAVLTAALQRWPAHPMIWGARFNSYLFSGRPASAAAFILNPEARPSGMGQDVVDTLIMLARAVEQRQASDVESSLAAHRLMALEQARSIPSAASMFAVLGRPDLAFQSLERYFFGATSGDRPLPAPGAYERRYAVPFFAPPMARYRGDPRFVSLVNRIGLERYWRESGSLPDYRR